jgi:thiamine transport system permease protein
VGDLAGHVFYNSTIVIRMVAAGLGGLDPTILKAARALGASPRQLWWHVRVPMVRQSVLAASILVFLFDFTSFGVILLLGAGRFSTLEVEIYYRLLAVPNLPLAGLLSLLQLSSTLFLLWLQNRFSPRRVQTRPSHLAPALRRPATRAGRLTVGVLSGVMLLFFLAPLVALPVRSVWRLEADRGQRGSFEPGPTVDFYRELFSTGPARHSMWSLFVRPSTRLDMLLRQLCWHLASGFRRPSPCPRRAEPNVESVRCWSFRLVAQP